MNNGIYFLKLLKWYINNEKGYLEPGIDWNEILRLSKIHSVSAMVYLAVERFEEKAPVYDELRKNFLASVNVAVLQDIGMNEVISAFNEKKIEHMPIKGYVLRNYYPNREARSFGDVDFFINEKDRQNSHDALLELGFEYKKEEYSKYVWTYEKGILNLEVHTSVITQKLFNDYDYVTYCSKMFDRDNWIPMEGYTYKLKDEDHFIYLLIHMAKHFYYAGIGIRMVLDFAVLINKIGEQLSFDYIKRELSKIQLLEFSNIIFFVCKKYFGAKVECSDIDAETENKILDYILGHGVFGYDDKNAVEINFKKEGSKGLKLAFEKIFPNYEVMKDSFYWFADCKKYMLPYGWIRRIFFNILNKEKRSSLKYRITTIANDSKDIDEYNEMMRIVGLKK